MSAFIQAILNAFSSYFRGIVEEVVEEEIAGTIICGTCIEVSSVAQPNPTTNTLWLDIS